MDYEEMEMRNNIFYQNTKYLLDSRLPRVNVGKGKDLLTEKYAKYELQFEPHRNNITENIKTFHERVEKALDEYFQYKYDISSEELEKVISNVNNFKLKHDNFHKVIQGSAEGYYDGDFLFLMVNTRDFNIYKRWSIQVGADC